MFVFLFLLCKKERDALSLIIRLVLALSCVRDVISRHFFLIAVDYEVACKKVNTL